MKTAFRVLTVLLVLAVAVSAVWFYVGGQQMRFTAETVIQDTSPEIIMQHLSDPQLVAQWATGVVEMEPDPESGTQSGARANVKVRTDGQQQSMVSEWLSSSSDSITVRTFSPDFEAISIWNVVRQEQGVAVRQLVVASHYGWWRFRAPFSREHIEEVMHNDLKQLKSMIETGTIDEPAKSRDDGESLPD